MLTLIDFSSQHFDWLIKNIQTKEQCQLWAGNTFSFPISKKELVDYAENPNNDSKIFSFYDTISQQIIGHIKMGEIREDIRSATVKNVLIDGDYRGQGIGTLMVAQACEYVLRNYDVKVIRLRVKTININAIKCYRRIGFIVLSDKQKEQESLRMFLTYNAFHKKRNHILDFENKKQAVIDLFKKKKGYFNKFSLEANSAHELDHTCSITIPVNEESWTIHKKLQIVTTVEQTILSENVYQAIFFLVGINGKDYLIVSDKDDSYKMSYDEHCILYENDVIAPNNIYFYNDNIVKIQLDCHAFVQNLPCIQIHFYMHCVKVDLALGNFKCENDILIQNICQCININNKFYLLENKNPVWAIFINTCKNTPWLIANGNKYAYPDVLNMTLQFMRSIKQYNITDYKVKVDIQNELCYLACSLAIFLLNNELVTQDQDVVVGDEYRASQGSFFIQTNEMLMPQIMNDMADQMLQAIPYKAALYKNVLTHIEECLQIDSATCINNIDIMLAAIITGKPLQFQTLNKKNEKPILNKLQDKILNAFEKILNKHLLEDNPNFFWEGGDSLAAMKLILELENINIVIELEDIINFPTVNTLSEFITKKEG